MHIGIPREIKRHEYRVGTTPHSVQEMVAHGHRVLVQKGAGWEVGLPDEHYLAAGAELVGTLDEVFARSAHGDRHGSGRDHRRRTERARW